MSCGLVEFDADGHVVSANAVFVSWYGGTLDDLVGVPYEALIESRLPLTNEDGAVPTDATFRSRGGDARPVVLGRLDADEPGTAGTTATSGMRLVVFDVSAGSGFQRGFSAASPRTARGQQRLQILLGASTGFAEVREEIQAAELLTDVANRSFAATTTSVHLLRDGEVVQVAGTNPLAEHWPPGAPPAGAATIGAGEVRVVRSPEEAAAYLPGARMDEVLRRAGIQAVLSSPIRFKGRTLGTMICYFDHPREFDEEAVPLAEALCNQAAQTLARLDLEQNLRRAALHDEVTGLPSRRLFEERVDRELRTRPAALCIFFVDLDGFKVVNDSLGHAAGDELLTEVGRRLQSIVRVEDAVGRFGGDEFIAMASIGDKTDAHDLAERIRAELARPYDGIGDLVVTASVGFACVDSASTDDLVVDRLIREADHAMYEAKAAGGNRVAYEGSDFDMVVETPDGDRTRVRE